VGSQRYRALRALVAQWNAGTSAPPPSVDVGHLETLLTVDDLARVMEVDSPAAFAALPRWQQLSLRKKAHLYLRPAAAAGAESSQAITVGGK